MLPFRATVRALTLAAFPLVSAVAPVTAATLPALPAVYLDTTPVAPTGTTITVNAGGDFQAALNTAQPGDVIVLQPGGVFTGPFTLPNKSGTGWITIRSATADSNLPPPGTRVTPAHAAVMPKLQGPNTQAAITTAAGAHHYRFVGVEFRPAPGTYTFGLIVLGTAQESTVSALPSNIIFDRCYIHGDAATGGKRGIALNSRSTAIIDSHLSDWKGQGQDTQAIGGWNGPGPFKIVNNYIEGAGENVLFGGADPSIANLVPSDIEFRGNLVSKPLAWNHNDPGTYAGARWTIKNLFELKNAARVLVDGNVFQNTWVDGQVGFAVQLTVRNQDGTAPWSTLRDVTFTNNIVRNSAGGINILGRDDRFVSDQTQRVLIKNNVFEAIGGPQLGTNGRLFQLIGSATDVTIDHNTAFHTGNVVSAFEGSTFNFVFRNNIVPHNDYGVHGGGMGVGNSSISAYFPDAQFARNVLAGGNAALYPADNFFPSSLSGVGFVNMSGGNYRLAASSPYNNAGTDGTDLGADIDALEGALSATAPPTGVTAGGGTGGGTGGTGGGTAADITAATVSVTSPTGDAGADMTDSTVSTTSPTGGTAEAGTGGGTGGTGGGASAALTVSIAPPTEGTGGGADADITPPTVSITTPTAGTVVWGTVHLRLTAADDVGISRIELRVDGHLVGTFAGTTRSISWKSQKESDGAHTLAVRAVDAAGNAGDVSVGVVVRQSRR